MDGQKEVKVFFYPEVMHNSYAYCDMIDNHNSQRMHPISIEETWMTTHWPNRVFGFLLAITVVNSKTLVFIFVEWRKLMLLGQETYWTAAGRESVPY